MRSWDALPDVRLEPAGPLTAEITARGVTDFRAAARYLQSLPYGRTANRADFSAVLREGRGTCSTKHALLAALAQEHELAVGLTLGIYEMHERNTPGVGTVLARYALASIPEAHCYLTFEGMRIDVTRSGADPTESIARFLHEEIGEYKVTRHRQFMRTWVADHPGIVRGRNFEDVWRIREECIAALAQ